MITLIQAFKLCGIHSEMVFLRTKGSRYNHSFWSTKIISRLDMKRIKVIGIEPRFESYGSEYLGMCFTVCGITEEELFRQEWYMMQMK